MALLVGFAFQADAELLVFNSRDAWQSALLNGVDLAYNFNSFHSDASFAASAINFGGFRMRAVGVPPPGTDEIHGDSALSQGLDGTPYASMFLDATRSVALDFTRPMLGFGADFSGLAMNFGVFQHGSRAATIIGGPTSDPQFFGIISTDPIDGILFLYAGPPNESTTVRFDNVLGASAGVPEPSSLMMLGMGAVTFVAYGCFRLRRGKTEPGPAPA
jgi:hypothetical protein